MGKILDRKCTFLDCTQKHKAKGFCKAHYDQYRKTGIVTKESKRIRGICSVDGCESLHASLGYCQKHYQRLRNHGDISFSGIQEKHGMRNTSEYQTWARIKQRCLNSNSSDYERYGKQGTTVCIGWAKSFSCFLKDMARKPSREYSIDRIDPFGHYSCGHCEECVTNGWPMNCRWATVVQQARNKKNTVLVSYKGISRPLSEWAEILDLSYHLLYDRIFVLEWDIEAAFEKNHDIGTTHVKE